MGSNLEVDGPLEVVTWMRKMFRGHHWELRGPLTPKGEIDQNMVDFALVRL